jgi:hypothetical protein
MVGAIIAPIPLRSGGLQTTGKHNSQNEKESASYLCRATMKLRRGRTHLGCAIAVLHQRRAQPMYRMVWRADEHSVKGLHPVEGGGAHPLEPGRINQHVERIFDPLMDDAALVDLAHTPRGSVSTRWRCGRLNVGRYSWWSRPLAAIMLTETFQRDTGDQASFGMSFA